MTQAIWPLTITPMATKDSTKSQGTVVADMNCATDQAVKNERPLKTERNDCQTNRSSFTLEKLE